jgi:hypothetical protein
MRERIFGLLHLCELYCGAERGWDFFGIAPYGVEEVFESPTVLFWNIVNVTLLTLPEGDVLAQADFNLIIRGSTRVYINWLAGKESAKSAFYNNPIIVFSTLGKSPGQTNFLQEEPTVDYSGISRFVKRAFGCNCGVFVTVDYNHESGETFVSEI